MQGNPDDRRVGTAFGVIAAVMLVGAALFYYAIFRLEGGGETAVGTVVDFRIVEYQKDRRYVTNPDAFRRQYATYPEPIIEFTTREGKSVRFNAIGAPREGVELGDTFEVVYLPSSPHSAELREMPRLWNGVWAMGALGAACLIPFFYLTGGSGIALAGRPLLWVLLHLRGTVVEARVASVRHVRRRKVSGDLHSIQIEAVWRDPVLGRTHHFVSNTIPIDVGAWAERNGLRSWEDHSKRMVAELHQKLRGQPVAVKVDLRFPGAYRMDPPSALKMSSRGS